MFVLFNYNNPIPTNPTFPAFLSSEYFSLSMRLFTCRSWGCPDWSEHSWGSDRRLVRHSPDLHIQDDTDLKYSHKPAAPADSSTDAYITLHMAIQQMLLFKEARPHGVNSIHSMQCLVY